MIICEESSVHRYLHEGIINRGAGLPHRGGRPRAALLQGGIDAQWVGKWDISFASECGPEKVDIFMIFFWFVTLR